MVIPRLVNARGILALAVGRYRLAAEDTSYPGREERLRWLAETIDLAVREVERAAVANHKAQQRNKQKRGMK